MENIKNMSLMSTEEMRDRLAEISSTQSISMQEFLALTNADFDQIRELFANYRCAAMEIETKFRVLNERLSMENHGNSNPIESINTRLKSPYSIISKLERRGLPMSVESIEKNIHDMAGVRVICSFINDIYLLADMFLAQDDITLVEKRDYIRQPKDSGYRSLHLIVQVPIFTEKGKHMMTAEVQLRTIAMDSWASLEHKLHYKKYNCLESQMGLKEELLACSAISAEMDSRMQRIKDLILSGRKI